MAQNNWRTPQNFPDLLIQTEKRLGSLERRPVPVSAADLLGPGAAKKAILVSDWNADVTAANGSYWSKPGALHAPDMLGTWTGSVIAKSDNSGMQQVWNTDDLANVQFYMRTFVDDGTGHGRTFSAWRHFATPNGYVNYEELGPDVQSALDAAAAVVEVFVPPLRVYRQTSAPTNPDSLGRALLLGDQWLDTDDDNFPYVWSGTAWVDYATYVLGEDILSGITGPSIIGGLVTGTLFQTSALAARGVKIASGGLVAYSGSGVPTVVVNAATGDVTITGALTAGSTIDGAAITGGTIQTEGTVGRGIKMNSAGLVAYSDGSDPDGRAAGDPTFVLDAATGAITMYGGVYSGGTITGAIIQTATSGPRIVLSGAPGDANIMALYTGTSETTPANLYASTDTGYGYTQGLLQLTSPYYGTDAPATIKLMMAAGHPGRVDINAYYLNISSPNFSVTGAGTPGPQLDVTSTGVFIAGTQVTGRVIGDSVVTTDASGQATFSLSLNIGGGTPVVIATGGNDEHVYVLPGSVSTSGFTAQFRASHGPNMGDLLVSTPVRCYYIAVGTI